MTRDADRIVAFLNSHHLPDGDDALVDERAERWLGDWLGYQLPAGNDLRRAHGLAKLRDVREGLRQLAAANNGQPADRRQLERAAESFAAIPVVLALGDLSRGPRLVVAETANLQERAIASVAESFFIARAGADWPRVKACASPDCRYAYLDTSRNRSRRWCEMASCGNRAKNRAWRQRHYGQDEHHGS